MNSAELLVEVSAVSLAARLYLAGVSHRATHYLIRSGSAKRRPRASGRGYPILLVHGMLHNRSWGVEIARELESQGFTCVTENHVTSESMELAASQLRDRVLTTCTLYNSKMHLVAHSMGGIVARLMLLEYPDTRKMVASVTTIGSPHKGAPIGRLLERLPLVPECVHEMLPGSMLLERLDRDGSWHGVPWTAISSPNDEVVPGDHGRLDVLSYRANNIILGGLGHMGLIYSGRAAREITRVLVEVDAELMNRDIRNWVRRQRQKRRSVPIIEQHITIGKDVS